jgi:Pro-kumamolisin, activation domain
MSFRTHLSLPMVARSQHPLLRYAFLGLLIAPVLCAPSMLIDSTPTPPSGNMTVHDARSAPPQGFVNVGNLPNDQKIDLEINLFGRDTPGLEKQLFAVSTPGSPSYRNHLSKEQVRSWHICCIFL